MNIPDIQDIVPILLCTMIFMHIIDDYYLQGILAQMKQKSWWEQYIEKDKQYKYDFIMALFMHGFSWSFMIHIPMIIMYYAYGFTAFYKYLAISIFVNSIIHSIIDHIKCNLFKINLREDQIIHLIQIVVVFFLFIILPLIN